MTIYYVDLVAGVDANNGLSYANRKKTIASVPYTSGDEIRIMGCADGTDTGIAGNWTNNTTSITGIPAGHFISLNDSGSWTSAGTGNSVSFPNSSNCKVSNSGVTHSIAGSFTTGKVGFFATGTLNLSAYNTVQYTLGGSSNINANAVQYKLCSDTAGATAVNTLSSGPIQSVCGFVRDSTGALGASIQSIGAYVNSDVGSSTVGWTMGNMTVTKSAEGLTTAPNCILSPTATSPYLHRIRGFQSTNTILLDQLTTDTSFFGPYAGPTVSGGNIFTRAGVQSAAGLSLANITTPITISFGWSPTDMATQNSDFIMYCTTPVGLNNVTGLDLTGSSGLTITKASGKLLCLFGFAKGVLGPGTNNVLPAMNANYCNTGFSLTNAPAGSANTIGGDFTASNCAVGFSVSLVQSGAFSAFQNFIANSCNTDHQVSGYGGWAAATMNTGVYNYATRKFRRALNS